MARRSEADLSLKGSNDMQRVHVMLRGDTYYTLQKLSIRHRISLTEVIEALFDTVDELEGQEHLDIQLDKSRRSKSALRSRRFAAVKVALKLGDEALNRLDQAYSMQVKGVDAEIAPLELPELPEVPGEIEAV